MTELGPIATEVLYEDEDIRIWDQRLDPGEATAPHHHEHDYVLINIAGDKVDVAPVEGGCEPAPDSSEWNLSADRMLWFPTRFWRFDRDSVELREGEASRPRGRVQEVTGLALVGAPWLALRAASPALR